MSMHPLDSPLALRRRFAEQFRPNPLIYWPDMLGSAGAGWAAFALSVLADHWAVAGAAGLVAAILLWRAAYFIHELNHLRLGALPGFAFVWHLVAGGPLLLPSLMIDAHVDHHRKTTYGTARDPEYCDVVEWSRGKMLLSVLLHALVPPLLVLRWAFLSPLGWISPSVRRFSVEQCSTLQSNHEFRRSMPKPAELRRWAIQEIGMAIFVWCAAGGLAVTGQWRWAVHWWAVMAMALMLNQVRTLVSHIYEGDGEPMSLEAQLLDTATLDGSALLTGWMTPVGTRFHALHHLLPTLPYHSLPLVHAALVAELGRDAPYQRTKFRGLLHAISWLWRRAANRSATGRRQQAAF